jgi:hypothetical protein
MLWVNSKPKTKRLDLEKRREIANNVITKLEQSRDLKVCADNMAGLLKELLKGIKDDIELRYAIGVSTKQIQRYIANQVYNLLK